MLAAMKNDKTLLNELNDLLDNFKNKIGEKGREACEKQIILLRGTFNQASRKFQADKQNVYAREESPFLEILLTLKNVMKTIDDEGRSLEKEMHGVDNYSDYEYMNVINFGYKKELKEELVKMLNLVRTERPDLRGKERFISI